MSQNKQLYLNLLYTDEIESELDTYYIGNGTDNINDINKKLIFKKLVNLMLKNDIDRFKTILYENKELINEFFYNSVYLLQNTVAINAFANAITTSIKLTIKQ